MFLYIFLDMSICAGVLSFNLHDLSLLREEKSGLSVAKFDCHRELRCSMHKHSVSF